MSNEPDVPVTAGGLWASHVDTGEPLGEDEVAIVVAAGLAEAEDWENRGGGLYWHTPTWPDADSG
jgi:hypothetical protein